MESKQLVAELKKRLGEAHYTFTLEEEEQINTEPLQKPKRKPLYMTWGVAAAAVFLSGVLVSPWILQQENSTTDEVNITQRNIDENASLDVATTNDSFSNDPHFTAENEMTPAFTR